jgi:hypothetical protein
MRKKTREETKTSGHAKKSLGTRGPRRQPPPSGESGTRRRRTEAVFRARKNPEEDEIVRELEKDINIATAVPSKKKRLLKVSLSRLTPSE